MSLVLRREMIKRVGLLILMYHISCDNYLQPLPTDQHDSEDSEDELSDIEPLNDTAHTDMSHFGGGDNMGFLESLIQEMGNEGETAGTTWEPYNIFGDDNDDNSDEMHNMDEPENNTNNKR